uniref:Uncharacterized protein n=1 Tax=Leptocylindrus aporus TaxID=1398097 RepID=A0A7S0K9A5_9STRA|mmetsp:Transcript_1448/g.1969  ORF Transcript_1448/g.1969 Transcript_1448/m.1969 type:complete len:307 (+) Transcript_1448:49-969(+)
MSPSNHRFLSIPLLPREERVLSREEREEENDDDLRLTTDILNGVILTSLCMFLVALSFAMIFVSDHIFAVIFLACLNVFFTAPIISLTETKIMEQVTVEKSIRRLERDVKKLTKENENKREREWELEKKRDKLEEYEELLEAIVDLQGEMPLRLQKKRWSRESLQTKVDHVVSLVQQKKEIDQNFKDVLMKKAVEDIIQIAVKIYRPNELSISASETDDIIEKIRQRVASVEVDEQELRNTVKTFGDLFNVLTLVLLNGTNRIIRLRQSVPDVFKTGISRRLNTTSTSLQESAEETKDDINLLISQ